MLKNMVTAVRLVPRQVVILLMIAGLTYLIYPQIASSAASEVVTPGPTPANQATADYLDALATADAFIRGTATPTPPNSQTATPFSSAATATLTRSPGSVTLVIVTATPTPRNIVTVAARAATATAVATAIGTYTPVPWNWVVPIVVTPEPATATPANAATAAFQAAEATAAAFVFGTPTPTPVYVWTATPTPFMRPVIGDVATPWVPPTPTPTPLPIPRELVGKIIFLSDRSGGPEPLAEPLVYVVDPDGSNLAVLTDYTFYNTALARDTYSADQQYRAFVKEPNGVPAIFYLDYRDKIERPITFFEFDAGGAWEPAWSPTQEQIAFVSDVSQFEEIWITNRDGSGLRQLTETDPADSASESGKDGFVPEANGHPSWSPDGSQIVFWSNRTGEQQIWVMNADGSNAHILSPSRYNDWNPIWVKYTDPAREPVFGIGEIATVSAQSNP
jgi:hypothetical protein